MSVIADAQLAKVRAAIDKIDNAVLAVQELAAREDPQFPNRPRLKGLRSISRELAKQEQALIGLFE